MFKRDNRYVTKGVKGKVDIRLQLIMWNLIDELKTKIEVDYLQLFRIEKKADIVAIVHVQEVPNYKSSYRVDIDDIQLEENLKVYVIDSGEYSTMLLPEEY